MKYTSNLLKRSNKIGMFFLSALIFCGFATSVNAVAPANDNLADAQTLSGASGAVNGNTVDATRQSGEYSHSFASGTTVYRTVWYQWTATENKPVVFEISSSGFDSSLAVYTGANYPLTWVSTNNDTTGNRPRVEFTATAGTTYKILVGLYNDQNIQGGDFTLQWATNNNPTNDNFANAMNLESVLTGSVAVSNQNATKEQGEPMHVAGNRSVWFTFTNNLPTDYSMTFSTGNSLHTTGTTLSVYTGSSLQSLTPVVKNRNMPSTNRSRVTFLAKTGVTYRIALDEGSNPNEWNAILSWGITTIKDYSDFARDVGGGEIRYDDAADIAVFRPSNGVWYIRNSSTNPFSNDFNAVQFGTSGDTPVQGDYDGDGRTDVAVARNTPNGKVWYILNSFDNTYKVVQFGLTGDKPVTGDYDFDGRVDIAVFRPSNSVWYIWKSSDGGFIVKEFGFSTDIPVSGDFKETPLGTDIAVFRPSNGTWYVLNGANTMFIPFGTAGDKPVVGDYDDDGKSDIGVYRPSNGTWYVFRYNEVQIVQWGLPDDIPMTGDYDNNSNDLYDFAVYRPSEGRWYILRSEENITEIRSFGLSDDIPVSSPALLAQ